MLVSGYSFQPRFKEKWFSKPQIAFESKAQADEKAQHTFKYVSILKRLATQLSDARWDFETASKRIGRG
jgi:hypothetical protein